MNIEPENLVWTSSAFRTSETLYFACESQHQHGAFDMTDGLEDVFSFSRGVFSGSMFNMPLVQTCRVGSHSDSDSVITVHLDQN